MNKYFLTLLLLCFWIITIIAQEVSLTGTVRDKSDNEPLIGATISIGDLNGAVSDFDGKYALQLDKGNYELTISYVGYTTQNLVVELTNDQVLDIALESDIVLKEILVTTDIAIERETPVAFSNIPTRKLEEELAAQDIPMILNSTPGVYATQSGGGDGDARVTIRGFDQRNIAVMLDGIPVNDMENGWVYWSNWFGLDLVTQTIQVQRGLGASKLSIPSVGGTINILTKGIDSKRSFKIQQEVGTNGFIRTTLGINSGRLKGGWGISAAGSYKQGDGWVDGNFTKGYFYYLRVDKQFGNHLVSLSGFGAPQEHGQRSFTEPIAQVDSAFAVKLGVPQESIDELIQVNKGRKFNEHWGTWRGKLLNAQKNFYHKPQFSLRHSWQINNRTFWSNILYLSIGKGGGTAPASSSDNGISIPRTVDGQLDFDRAEEKNLEINFAKPDTRSLHILRASKNEHFWYGGLSSIQFEATPSITISGGLDARYYKGDHYREVNNLLGGSYFWGANDRVKIRDHQLVEGDKITYDYSGFVRWTGLFGLLEFKQDRWSAFLNVSGAATGYKFEDYFNDLVVTLPDTILTVTHVKPVTYNDITYTVDSPEAQNNVIDWVNYFSTSIKTGASFKIDHRNNIFFNTGYLRKPPRYNNTILTNSFGDRARKASNVDYEKILAFESGYSFGSPKFSANFNSYYTIWKNKPLSSARLVPVDSSDPDSERVPINIPGIDARHLGIELDFAYQPIKSLAIEGLVSIGDWIWNSSEIATVSLPQLNYEYEFDAKGVHVGDAAQIQVGGLVRYEPVKGLYLKLTTVHFAKNYAQFEPEDLQGEDGGRESWQMPNYTVFSFHSGYFFKVKNIGFNIRTNIINLFDTTYISDARNNDPFAASSEDFDAKSASVHFGQGRRGTVSLQISF